VYALGSLLSLVTNVDNQPKAIMLRILGTERIRVQLPDGGIIMKNPSQDRL
jgi:hypothetical protein